jgi:hypothetical protein
MGEGTRVVEHVDKSELKELQDKVDDLIRQFEALKASMQPYSAWGGWPPNQKYWLDNKCDSGYDWNRLMQIKPKDDNE